MAESSVRVEVGGDDWGEGPDGPVPPRPSSSRRGIAIGVAMVALVLVGTAVFSLRPETGEAADGSTRQVTTTTTTPTTTTTTVGEDPVAEEPVIPKASPSRPWRGWRGSPVG